MSSKITRYPEGMSGNPAPATFEARLAAGRHRRAAARTMYVPRTELWREGLVPGEDAYVDLRVLVALDKRKRAVST